jgi:hypothetical protein
MRVVEVQWSWALSLVREVALSEEFVMKFVKVRLGNNYLKEIILLA